MPERVWGRKARVGAGLIVSEGSKLTRKTYHKMLTIEEVVTSPYLVLSVIGEHAGEGLDKIFLRKQKEIEQTGKSFWLIQSYKAKPDMVQNLCLKAKENNQTSYCIFIQASAANGARPTLKDRLASCSSINNKDWEKIPSGIKVTGNIGPRCSALVCDELKLADKPLTFDLWHYSEFNTGLPIKMMLGASTFCCQKQPTVGIKNHVRKIWAIAKLAAPYSVWLK